MENLIGWKDISLSEAGEEALRNLEEGVVMLLLAKRINDSTMDKVQLEFGMKVPRTQRGAVELAIGHFNSDDKRFSGRARRTWVSLSEARAKELFGVELAADEQYKEICQVVTKDKENGKFYAIQVIEQTEDELPQDIADFKEYHLKRRSQDGPIFHTPGDNPEPIYSYTRLIFLKNANDKVPHIYLEGTARDVNKRQLKSQAAISSDMTEATRY